MKFILTPGQLSYADIKKLIADESLQIELTPECIDQINQSSNAVKQIIQSGQTVYGINTGFGKLANTKIKTEDLELLQKKLILSHAAGTGTYLCDEIVRLILLLKINSLARGFSGVRLQVIEYLIRLFNNCIYPCIPSQGSVGASGDLAPLAHLSTLLLGEGNAHHHQKIISAKEALALIDLDICVLAPKEGLTLLNGTQVSTAIAIKGVIDSENILNAAIVAGALSVDAARGSATPFDTRIQSVRGQDGQIKIAECFRKLLHDSEILASHQEICHKIQDPYSLRCQPQVLGACLNQLEHNKNIIICEANAVSDNPLVFLEDDQTHILSGGNFHAEPVAIAADCIAIALAEIGSISERKIALLIDPNFSGLPAFLVNNPGLNSGFMLAQVTAAALASENKTLAHPASIDSLPTSANQEDHVSMATFAACKLLTLAENVISIIGIELLAAAQGIDLLRPLKTSSQLEQYHHLIRTHIDYYHEDRYFAPDIIQIKNLVKTGMFNNVIKI